MPKTRSANRCLNSLSSRSVTASAFAGSLFWGTVRKTPNRFPGFKVKGFHGSGSSARASMCLKARSAENSEAGILAGRGAGGCWDRNIVSETPTTRKRKRNNAGKICRFGFMFILLVAKRII
jgi:hypothetical protein